MSEYTERQLINRIREYAGATADDLIRGIGDDCSVFGKPGQGPWLVSTDMLVDSVHFDRSWHDPRLLGRKCVAVNLSDIAAMGGDPRFLLVSVSVPGGFSPEWLTTWFEGVMEILAEYNCLLIGGDTVTGKELTFSITVIGTQLPEGVLYRSGAKEGDSVYVSGRLGSSAAGLALLKKIQQDEIQTKRDVWDELFNAHLNPVPQVELGKLLCKSGFVTAMQDISDGLSTDLSHICHESEVGAVIYEEKLPSLPLLDPLCKEYAMEQRDLVLKGGEDYQLVFTIQEGREKEVENLVAQHLQVPISPIGEICSGQGVVLQSIGGGAIDITFLGYEHSL